MRVQLPGCEICHLCPRPLKPRSQRWLPDLDQIHVYMEKRTRPLRGNITFCCGLMMGWGDERSWMPFKIEEHLSNQPTNQPANHFPNYSLTHSPQSHVHGLSVSMTSLQPTNHFPHFSLSHSPRTHVQGLSVSMVQQYQSLCFELVFWRKLQFLFLL